MTYCIDLSDHFIKNTPQWYRNIWNACATFAEIDAELLKFKGVLKTRVSSSDLRSICPEVFTNHYVEFESEADYVFCLLRWS
jgi:hypothetical protein